MKTFAKWIFVLKMGDSQYFQMKNDSFCTRSKAPTRQHDDSKSHSAVWDSFSVLSRFDIAASMATQYQVSILFWILPKTDPIWIILDSTPTLSFLFLLCDGHRTKNIKLVGRICPSYTAAKIVSMHAYINGQFLTFFDRLNQKVQLWSDTYCCYQILLNLIQGVLIENCQKQMAAELNWSTFDPMLVKPKWVWQMVDHLTKRN